MTPLTTESLLVRQKDRNTQKKTEISVKNCRIWSGREESWPRFVAWEVLVIYFILCRVFVKFLLGLFSVLLRLQKPCLLSYPKLTLTKMKTYLLLSAYRTC